ncbi:3-phosphoshikimate 1-carboxyvinyltransferase [Chlorobium phaeovibrioides]|uniref:3-phosphoshikimate 1-carboxyvinyltransferase n=1 Tax=Chlorobium phaeovibrioides TaxID=1094 RepID=A0A5M8I926_CHLPH|nr:3-phosphoshikimate 1-carboxyvinyltransferase [Chlorobium phaeovibrioides]KAA6231988.1 3-phosphoshikimate 1-carboxyvinyltransferase [Chlorobium phaeovibrioides]
MSVFKGEVTTLPPDKSISHRAALIGALAEGVTEITNFSGGFDNQSTLGVLGACGIPFTQEEVPGPWGGTIRRVVIESKGLWSFRPSGAPLECNNSGSTMRMMAGILAGQPFGSELVGDGSLMKRPMQRVAGPLRDMGAGVELSESGTAPMRIAGTKELRPIVYRLPVPSAQVKSLVAFAALHAEGESRIIEPVLSRDHTELMLGLEASEVDGERVIVVPGRRRIEARPFLVPADPSAACFIVALALLAPGSEIMIRDVCLNPTRAAFLDIMIAAGGQITIENRRTVGGEDIGDILARGGGVLEPLSISDPGVVARVIDEIPMLAVLSVFASGSFEVSNAGELRTKECDRLNALAVNLQRLGCLCEESPDGMRVSGGVRAQHSPVVVECFDDHRIAMSFAIAARATGMDIELSDSAVVGVSFPNFFALLESLEV